MTAFWTMIRSTARRLDEWTPAAFTPTTSMQDPAVELARLTQGRLPRDFQYPVGFHR
ncbi:hypothetical protein GCM10010472_23760 [Pseudonocardia halophobica]|uniref:Uncharacterized protein n=1 Tax=Pseudonocardia halophobica TaxID=29401 RepID=A0A9W6L218_9PSEU|nr:hypothetical protein [Pseudonocardia halophobica]GLL09609.1 hypothetical protein GCM10017577_07490 [Pseudonocardia halophobica]